MKYLIIIGMLKDEHTLFKSDIEGLLEILLKFIKNIFENYSLNISNYPTLPSLSLSIYTSSFYNESNKIKNDQRTGGKDIENLILVEMLTFILWS